MSTRREPNSVRTRMRALKCWPIVLVVVLVGCCTSRTAKNKIDVPSVENDIRAHLPIGSSKASAIAFFDERKIPHGWLRKAESSPDGKTVIPNSHVETGIIGDVRIDGFIIKTFVSIQVDFKFDDSDSKLVSYSVREIYKGP